MKYNLSFEERARICMEKISMQSPVTLEEARKQALWLKQISITNTAKKSGLPDNSNHDKKVRNGSFLNS